MLRTAIPRGSLPKFSPSLNLRLISTSTFVPPAPSHGLTPPHLLTLADLTVPQIQSLITSAIDFKAHYKASAIPPLGRITELPSAIDQVDKSEQTLAGKTVALIFSKRSTRTRVASETSIKLLGEFFLSNCLHFMWGLTDDKDNSWIVIRWSPDVPWFGGHTVGSQRKFI